MRTNYIWRRDRLSASITSNQRGFVARFHHPLSSPDFLANFSGLAQRRSAALN
jgi:hypothetical protein